MKSVFSASGSCLGGAESSPPDFLLHYWGWLHGEDEVTTDTKEARKEEVLRAHASAGRDGNLQADTDRTRVLTGPQVKATFPWRPDCWVSWERGRIKVSSQTEWLIVPSEQEGDCGRRFLAPPVRLRSKAGGVISAPLCLSAAIFERTTLASRMRIFWFSFLTHFLKQSWRLAVPMGGYQSNHTQPVPLFLHASC